MNADLPARRRRLDLLRRLEVLAVRRSLAGAAVTAGRGGPPDGGANGKR